MPPDYDLVIRNGLLVDGTGDQPRLADVAVKEGKIAAVGLIDARGREEIDAGAALVTPGFVDIHTHYDGHATWSNRLQPSSQHGVTTVVTGNCGVGFAPCRAEDRAALVRLMEGVEDIPEIVMTEGLPWNWTTFDEFLDTLDGREFDMDVATQVPHAPMRVYVMGQRAIDHEMATPDDIQRMAGIARDAIRAGALGFSTSRALNHRASDGTLTPTLHAGEDELLGIAQALGGEHAGVLQLISDFDDAEHEFDILERVVRETGRPLSLSLMQTSRAPRRWEYLLSRVEAASDAGLPIRAQVCGRPVGVMMGVELSYNPFFFCPSYKSLARKPFAEKLAALRDPAMRSKLLAEFPVIIPDYSLTRTVSSLDRMFLMEGELDYEPSFENSIDRQARRLGQDPAEYAYDLMVSGDGRSVFYLPNINYIDGNIEAAETMLRHKDTVLGLGDGGAHCGLICDASLPTYMLARWTGGPEDGLIPLPEVIRALTSQTAGTVGLNDRGIIAPGYKADINIIDLDAVRLHRPQMVYDLPAGGARLGQRASGILVTIVNGSVTYRGGEPTGALPGRLVRGAQQAPSTGAH